MVTCWEGRKLEDLIMEDGVVGRLNVEYGTGNEVPHAPEGKVEIGGGTSPNLGVMRS